MDESIRRVYGAGVRLENPGSGVVFRQEVLVDEQLSYGRMQIDATLIATQEGFTDFVVGRLRGGGYSRLVLLRAAAVPGNLPPREGIST